MAHQLSRNILGWLVGAACIVHIWAAFTQGFQVDEISSIFFANSYPAAELVTQSIEPIHTNAFYLLLKGVLAVHGSPFVARALMLAIFGGSVWVIWHIAKTLKFTQAQKLVFLLPFISSVYILRFSFLVRMYGVGILLMLLSLWLLLRAINQRKDLTRLVWWSAAIDTLGVLMVFGYAGWVALKLLALVWLVAIKKQQHLKQLLTTSVIPLLASVFFLQNVRTNPNAHLGWLQTPTLPDIGLGLASLLGGGWYLYFEGITSIGPTMQLLGGVMTLGTIIVTAWLGWRTWQARQQKPTAQFVFQFLASTALLGWTLLASFSVLTQQPLLHIRQLFPIAVLLTLGLGLWLAQQWPKPWAVGLLAVYLTLSAFHWYGDYFTGQAYPAYSVAPAMPGNHVILIHPQDFEFAFHFCETYSFQTITDHCQQKNVFTKLENLPTADFYAITHNLEELQLETDRCQQEGARVYRCTQ